jgi:hypothetical protein
MARKGGFDVLEFAAGVLSWAVFFFENVVLAQGEEGVGGVGGGDVFPVVRNCSVSLKVIRVMDVILKANTRRLLLLLLLVLLLLLGQVLNKKLWSVVSTMPSVTTPYSCHRSNNGWYDSRGITSPSRNRRRGLRYGLTITVRACGAVCVVPVHTYILIMYS